MRGVPVPLLLLCACHDAGPATREPDEYIGCAVDENWATFDEAADVVSTGDAPLLLAPAAGASLPSSSPPDFRWQASPSAPGAPAGDVPMSCAQWNTGFSTLHLEPITGTVYDLQVAVGGQVRHRALTTLQRWTAPPLAWSALAGQAIEVRLRRMTVTDNERTAGPFVAAAPATFTVE